MATRVVLPVLTVIVLCRLSVKPNWVIAIHHLQMLKCLLKKKKNGTYQLKVDPSEGFAANRNVEKHARPLCLKYRSAQVASAIHGRITWRRHFCGSVKSLEVISVEKDSAKMRSKSQSAHNHASNGSPGKAQRTKFSCIILEDSMA